MTDDNEILITLQDMYPPEDIDHTTGTAVLTTRRLDALRPAHPELVFEQDPNVSLIINVRKKRRD